MNLKTENSRLDLFYEAARIYLLKVNASHTKILWSNDKTIIGLDWAKYRDLSLYRKLIICLSLWLRQIMNLLATDKSRYFAKPSPIIVWINWIFHIINIDVISETFRGLNNDVVNDTRGSCLNGIRNRDLCNTGSALLPTEKWSHNWHSKSF